MAFSSTVGFHMVNDPDARVRFDVTEMVGNGKPYFDVKLISGVSSFTLYMSPEQYAQFRAVAAGLPTPEQAPQWDVQTAAYLPREPETQRTLKFDRMPSTTLIPTPGI